MPHNTFPRAVTQAASNDTPWYRREIWLVLALGALLPVTLAIFLSQGWKVPLLGLTGTMVAASGVMLIRQQRGILPGDDREHVVHETSTIAGE